MATNTWHVCPLQLYNRMIRGTILNGQLYLEYDMVRRILQLTQADNKIIVWNMQRDMVKISGKCKICRECKWNTCYRYLNGKYSRMCEECLPKCHGCNSVLYYQYHDARKFICLHCESGLEKIDEITDCDDIEIEELVFHRDSTPQYYGELIDSACAELIDSAYAELIDSAYAELVDST